MWLAVLVNDAPVAFEEAERRAERAGYQVDRGNPRRSLITMSGPPSLSEGELVQLVVWPRGAADPTGQRSIECQLVLIDATEQLGDARADGRDLGRREADDESIARPVDTRNGSGRRTGIGRDELTVRGP